MSDFPVTLNNHTYNEVDMDPFGYIVNMGAMNWDLVNQLLLQYVTVSTDSYKISTLGASKTITVGAGLAWLPGDAVAVIATTATSRGYTGIVSAYNFATGSMTITIDYKASSGFTFAAWNVMPGGLPAGVSSRVTQMAPVNSGGTGYGGIDFSSVEGMPGTAMLGVNSPRTSMEEIYHDFAGNIEVNNVIAGSPLYVFFPWTLANTLLRYDVPGGQVLLQPPTQAALNSSTFYGGIYIQPVNKSPLVSALLSFNTEGFFHVGRGATVYETVVVNPVNSDIGSHYQFRFGLAGQNSSNPNIFSYAGIGFEAFNGVNGGLITCVCAANGVATRVVTSVAPLSTHQRFRIEVDAPGQNVYYYIDGVAVATISLNVPITDYRNLLYPAYEVPGDIAAFASGTPNYLIVDVIQVRKFLLR